MGVVVKKNRVCQKWRCASIGEFRDRSLFMTGGGRRKLTIYEKIFQGPFGLQTKHLAAHSTSHNNFSMPTPGEQNLHT